MRILPGSGKPNLSDRNSIYESGTPKRVGGNDVGISIPSQYDPESYSKFYRPAVLEDDGTDAKDQKTGNRDQKTGNRGYYVNTGNQPYMTQLNALYDQIVNRKPFQYDLNGDLLYRQYADQYAQLGQQAMRDTMGQAAALTGGYGNSYAQQVGNQAYQQYLTQLNAMVPEFWDRAFKAWQAEGDDLTNRYKLAAAHPSYLQSMQPRYVSGGGGSDKKGDGATTGTTDGEKTGWYDTLNQYAQGILGLMGTGNVVNGQAYNPIAGIYDAQRAEDKKKK